MMSMSVSLSVVETKWEKEQSNIDNSEMKMGRAPPLAIRCLG
jgi:hypothetical protein